MLNIPDSVKALFKQDGVRKNFRVQFPNGEYPDITNENIVQESVKFTESICSQDVMKFGLTEASAIEFETVGIGNMFGMTISCGIEIDLSSLSAADIAVIASGTWDGVYTAEADSDIGYAYFRVPYGVFSVDKCPRDHEAMTHRKVSAYSNLGTSNLWKQANDTMLSIPGDGSARTYTPSADALALSAVYASDPDYLLNLNYGKTTLGFDTSYSSSALSVSNSSPTIQNRKFQYKTANGTTKTVYPAIYYRDTTVNSSVGGDVIGYANSRNNISAYFPNVPDRETILQAYHGIMTDLDLEQSGYASWDEVDNAFWGVLVTYVDQYTSYGTRIWWASGKNSQHYSLDNGESAYYLYRPDIDLHLFFMMGVGYYTYNSNTHLWTGTKLLSFDTGTFAVYIPDVAAPLLWVNLSYNNTGTAWNPIGNGGIGGYFPIFLDAFKILDILNAYLEINAEFGKVNRNGTVSAVQLSDDSPTPVIPSEYSSAWWDEYTVRSVGSVNFPLYTQEVCTYSFGDGTSVYDMSDNAMLKSTVASQGTIEQMLDRTFIPKLDVIHFTPIELEAKGLPYWEAGDALTLTAEDGTVVDTYVMRMEINGIQVLTANIESTSGSIIGSEAE